MGLSVSNSSSGASPGGAAGDAQYYATGGDLGGAPQAVPFEFYGGVGDGVTDNATALAAFVTAATAVAGTRPIVLELGAGTYLVNSGTYVIPKGGIKGQGSGASVLKYTADAVFLQLNSDDTHLRDFTLLGDHGTSAQVAIQCGVSGGAVCPDQNITLDGLSILNFYGGVRCINGSGSSHRGVHISNCEIRVSSSSLAAFGIAVAEQAEFVTVVGCKIYGSTVAAYYGIGLDIAAGNLHATGCMLSELNIGVNLTTGTNAGHGSFVGGCINHCSAPFKGTGDFNGFYFDDVDMYGGQFFFHTGLDIHLHNCRCNPDAGGAQQILVDGAGTGNRFTRCTFVNNPTIDIASTGQIWFEDCSHRNGTIPSNIASQQQRLFTFAADANETLSLQASTAKIVVVASGVISVSRQITINQAPADAKSRAIHFINDNANDVTVKWTTGTAVTVPAGKTAVVGSDGTNAKLLQQSAAAGASSGAAGTVQTSNGAGAFSAATDVLAGSGYISFGTTPPAAGYLRCTAPAASTTHLIRLNQGGTEYDAYQIDTSGGNQIFGNTGGHNSVFRGYGMSFATGAGNDIVFTANTTEILRVRSTGVQFGGGGADFGGGTGVIGIDNASVNPTTNPTGGGILYADAGAGKWRGSSGTVTTFGPAEPHCPTCGRDFAVEHRNDTHDEHLALCLPCLVDALRGAGIDTQKFTIADRRSATKDAWDAAHAAARARAAQERTNTPTTPDGRP